MDSDHPCTYVNTVGNSISCISNVANFNKRNIIENYSLNYRDVSNAFLNAPPKIQKIYDREKALEESRRILATIDCYNNISYSNNISLATRAVNFCSCFFCKLLIPVRDNSNCKLCNEIFCVRHKSEINHKCEKLNKDTSMYLSAKNQFKLKLKEVKSKARR